MKNLIYPQIYVSFANRITEDMLLKYFLNGKIDVFKCLGTEKNYRATGDKFQSYWTTNL